MIRRQRPERDGRVSLCGVGLLLLCGCGLSWQARIDAAQKMVRSASRIAEPWFARECMQRAERCGAGEEKACAELDQCQASRRAFNDVLNAADYKMLEALNAFVSGNKDTTQEKLAAALALITELNKQLYKLGVMP